MFRLMILFVLILLDLFSFFLGDNSLILWSGCSYVKELLLLFSWGKIDATKVAWGVNKLHLFSLSSVFYEL